MGEILTKAIIFMMLIALGYFCKKIGIFDKNDATILGKITMNVTLPAAIITSFQGVQISFLFLVGIVLGFVCAVITLIGSLIVSKKETPVDQAMYGLLSSGYNIGNFAIPYANGFLASTAMPYVYMFDIGNAFLVTGGTYAFFSSRTEGSKKVKLLPFFKKLARAVPLIAYLVMIVFSLTHLKFPDPVLDYIALAGSANAFLSFFMIGIAFELDINKKDIRDVCRVLGTKYVIAVMLGVIVYFALPLPLDMKQAVILCLFAPVSTASLVFGTIMGCKLSVLGVCSSLSMILSMVFMTSFALSFA